MPQSRRPTLHLVSDSTGETLQTLARAALAPFGDADVAVQSWIFVRSLRDVDAIAQRLDVAPGAIFYTIADPALRATVEEMARSRQLPAIAALDPLVACLSGLLGQAPAWRPGMQHRLNSDYFARIAALDYAIAYDDGAAGDRLAKADVILTGVSRTSKTPTCIYLAYRGVKAANVPLVPGRDPAPAFLDAISRGTLTVGLTASPARLAQIRAQRLEALAQTGQTGSADYADLERIRAECAAARLFFERHSLPVIDVTRRSIEETAAEVLALLRAREGDER